MTPSDFIVESLNFEAGKIYVVSGQDIDKIMNLLYAAAEQIEMTGTIVLVYDFRCRPTGSLIQGGCKTYLPSGTTLPTRAHAVPEQQSILWESYSIMIQEITDEGTPMMILIGNQFNPDDRLMNPSPISHEVDVVRDMMSPFNSKTVTRSRSLQFNETRDLFPYLSKLFFYNTNTEEITLRKQQARYWPENIGVNQSIVIGSPIAGEQFVKGKKLVVIWNSTDLPVGSDIKVELWKTGTKFIDLTISTPDDGKFTWVIPSWIDSGNDYAIRLELISTDYSVTSLSAEFEIL